MRSPLLVPVLALAALALAACGGPSEPLVARGKGVAIRAADVRAKIEALPPAQRERYASRDAVRALVDDLVLGELQARAAEQAGFKNETGDPAGKKRMVQAMLVKRFADPEGAKAIPEDELRRAYEEHRSEYVQPLKLGVLHLFLDAPAGSPERGRKEALAKAIRKRIAAAEKADPDSPFAFAAVAREVSEEPGSREQGGDLGRLSKEDLGRRFSPEIADKVWQGTGNRTSDVLASDRGFHILKLNGGTPAVSWQFEDVKDAIALRIYRARSAQAYQAWIGELRERAAVVIDEAELDRAVAAAAAPPSPVVHATGAPVAEEAR